MKAIVWTNPADGMTWITHPAPNGRLVTALQVEHNGELQVLRLDPTPLDRIKLALAKRGISFDVLEQESEEAWIERIRAKDLPKDATNVRIVERSDLPAKDEFRNAMRHDLTFDMEHCRAIWKEKMRSSRKPKLDDLDRQWHRATGGKKSAEADAVEAKRQALRDVTDDPRLAAAKTKEDLKRVWHEELGPCPQYGR